LVAFESVTGACEAEDVSVVHDAVDHRGRDGGVAENLAPEPEGEVARHDERRVFVAGRDELEEQVRGVLIEWDVADFVNLCRHRHKLTYADSAIMPTPPE